MTLFLFFICAFSPRIVFELDHPTIRSVTSAPNPFYNVLERTADRHLSGFLLFPFKLSLLLSHHISPRIIDLFFSHHIHYYNIHFRFYRLLTTIDLHVSILATPVLSRSTFYLTFQFTQHCCPLPLLHKICSF